MGMEKFTKKLKKNMKTIEEKNRIIAEFMGCKAYVEFPMDAEYHISWDWIMPVIKECKAINHKSKYGHFTDKVDNLRAQILYEDIKRALLDLNINDAFDAIVEMVEWYNEKKKK